MVIFGVELEKEADDFMRLSEERLNKKTIVYKGYFKKFRDFYLIDIQPLIFPFYWIGFMGVLSTLYFAGLTIYLIPSIIISLSYLFWSKYFIYYMLMIGLRKSGYKGKIKLIKHEELLREVVFYRPD